MQHYVAALQVFFSFPFAAILSLLKMHKKTARSASLNESFNLVIKHIPSKHRKHIFQARFR